MPPRNCATFEMFTPQQRADERLVLVVAGDAIVSAEDVELAALEVANGWTNSHSRGSIG